VIKKILYVLIFLIVLFCAFYTNSDELYMWMYILLGVPLLSFALLGIASLRLKYTESIDNKTVTRGDNVNYRLKIHNEDFFMYPFVQTHFYVDHYISRELFQTGYYFLFPRKEYVIEKGIPCSHIGQFNIGIKEFRLTDYFGFFTLKTAEKTSVKIIRVLPKIHYIPRFSSVQGNVEEKVSISGEKGVLEDYTEIEAIDEYKPGVPFKKVHWKVSAAKDKLMVKEFAHPNDLSVSMFVDIDTGNYKEEDKLIASDIVLESALSIAHYFVNNNITCKIMMNDMDMTDRTVADKKDFEGYYDFMSILNMDQWLSFEDIMRNYYTRYFASRDAIIVSGRLSEDLMDLIVELKMAGINVVLITPVLGSPEEKRKTLTSISILRDKKITVFDLSSADDIGSVLHS
jgi:hypothetical protein